MVSQIKYVDTIGFLSLLIYFYLALSNANLFSFLTIILIEWSLVLLLVSFMTDNSKSIINKIFIWSILFQITSFFCLPILDDDYYRYLWDGYIFSITNNPYQSLPADYFNRQLPEDMDHILNLVNYPHIRTIYGPVCQYLFLLANYFRPHQIFIIKFFLMIANIVSIGVISRITKAKYFVLFAWCPLLIIETLFEVHIEMISIAFTLLAMYLTFIKHTHHSLQKLLTMFFCACAIAAKIFSAPFILLILLKHSTQYWFLFFVFLLFIYSPFMMSTHLSDLPSLHLFLSQWQFNGSLFEVIKYFFGQDQSRIICFLIFSIVFLIFIVHYKKNKMMDLPRGDILYGFLLLLSPVVNPWYLLWLLIFAAIFPSFWIWSAIIIVPLSYLNGFYLDNMNIAPYQIPFAIQFTEYFIVLLALTFDSIIKKPKMKFI